MTNASGAAITSSTNIANINPIRYRGYFYDTETKLYYCNSRYYDPQVRRLINADELLSTGTGFLGYNMFAYCENNPVMCSDPSGEMPFVIPLIAPKVLEIILLVVGLMITAKGAADDLKDFIDSAPKLFSTKHVSGALSTATLKPDKPSLPVPPVTFTEEDAQTITGECIEANVEESVEREHYSQIIFPVNPYEFCPAGLVRKERAGTNNGKLINWMDPKSNVEVFRWDENLNWPNGPHYHVCGTGHYKPGIDCVPEPYATIYFPFVR